MTTVYVCVIRQRHYLFKGRQHLEHKEAIVTKASLIRRNQERKLVAIPINFVFITGHLTSNHIGLH